VTVNTDSRPSCAGVQHLPCPPPNLHPRQEMAGIWVLVVISPSTTRREVARGTPSIVGYNPGPSLHVFGRFDMAQLTRSRSSLGVFFMQVKIGVSFSV